jgi:hypothetical protein
MRLLFVITLVACGRVGFEQHPDDGVVDGDTCQPSTEACNSLDDDCDGSSDEGFDLETDLSNCGSCGSVCSTIQRCTGGTCVPLGPIMFDQSHGNFSSYATFRSLLTTRGYNVTIDTTPPLSDALLAGVSVLVLPIIDLTTAYSNAELTALERAVEGGMGLLLITDIGVHHVVADPIAARFALSFGADIQITTMTVAQHPISTGVTQLVRDSSAASIVFDADSVPMLASGDAFLTATPNGGPETVLGRVITLTDVNMFADFFGGSGNPMATVGTDNAVLASNVIAWLTGHL